MAITFLTGFIILSCSALIVLGVLSYSGVLKTNTTTNSQKPYIMSPPPTTLTTPTTPTSFKTGYIDNLPPQQKIADNCNSVMYPINHQYVNYGTPRSSDCCGGECDVNIFNYPP